MVSHTPMSSPPFRIKQGGTRRRNTVQTTHPLDESAIAEIREIIFSALPVDYGFPRGQTYCN